MRRSTLCRRLKPALNAEMCDGIRALIQTIPSLSAPRASEKDKVSSRANDFLRAHSPPPILRLEEEFVPLFPRASHPKAGPRAKNAERQTPSVLKSVAELPIMIPPAEIKEEPEEELFKQHMRVVDGWSECLLQLISHSNGYNPKSKTHMHQLHAQVWGPRRSMTILVRLTSYSCHLPRRQCLYKHCYRPEWVRPVSLQHSFVFTTCPDEVEIPRSRKRGGARAKPRGIGAGTR